jgi:hypothetical protein
MALAGDSRTLELIIEAHNKASGELDKVSRSVGGVDEKATGATKSIGGLDDAISKAARSFGGGEVASTLLTGSIAGLAVGVVALGKAWIDSAAAGARAITQLHSDAEKLNITGQQLASLQVASINLTGSEEGLSVAFAHLQRVIGDAARGNQDALKTFTELGISITGANGQVRSAYELLGEIASRFRGGALGAKEMSFAMDLFGRGGANVTQMLRNLSGGLREAEEMAKSLSGTNEEAHAIYSESEKRINLLNKEFELQDSWLKRLTANLREYAAELRNALAGVNQPKETAGAGIQRILDQAGKNWAPWEALQGGGSGAFRPVNPASGSWDPGWGGGLMMALQQGLSQSNLTRRFEDLINEGAIPPGQRMADSQGDRSELIKQLTEQADEAERQQKAEEANTKFLSEQLEIMHAQEAEAQKFRETYFGSEGFKKGLHDLEDYYSQHGARMQELTANIAQSMEVGFAGFFASMEHGFKGIEDVARSFANSLMQIGNMALAKAVMGPITSGVSGLFGAAGGMFPGGITAFSGGGMVKAKNPLIGIIGEGDNDELVLPVKSGMADLSGVRRGGGGGISIGALHVHVHALDTRTGMEALAGPLSKGVAMGLMRELYSDPKIRSMMSAAIG